MQSFRERPGGQCGPLQDQVVLIDAMAMMASSGVMADCAEDAPDVLSSDECKLTRAYTCTFPTGSASFVAFTEERDGGDRITGTLTATAFDEAGTLQCRSTYDVTYVRQ